MNSLFRSITLVFALFCSFSLSAQKSCDQLSISLKSDIPGKCAEQVMTVTPDKAGRPFLYVANKSAGLIIHDISAKNPYTIASLPVDSFDDLEVMGVLHHQSFLYLALGNFFSTEEAAGMAIVDISDPTTPHILDVWKHDAGTEGSSQVVVNGNYAFLAAFSNGVISLDISNPRNIKQVGQIIPMLNYPDDPPDGSKINARGMTLENDILYLCYDAGGIRIINVSDPTKPKETGRYSNPVMNNEARAYNNVVKHGKYLYCGVDYCGVEILDVSDTSNIKEVSWWNPWSCDESSLNWFKSNGHVNEVRMDTNEMKLFVSTGKSDLVVVDVSDPANPDSCSSYGGLENSIGTWGLELFENNIYLTYICTFIPFSSNWTGVKHLTFNRSASIQDQTLSRKTIFPNPITAGEEIQILESNPHELRLYSSLGNLVKTSNEETISTDGVSPGIYLLIVLEDSGSFRSRIVVK